MIVIVGESACGKSTVEKVLVDHYRLKKVTSYTTRPPREGEIDGVDYYFITYDEFLGMKDEFVEIGAYRGWFYGTKEEQYSEDSVAVVTPHGLRSLRKNLKTIPFTSFYIKVSRKNRLIKMLMRGTDDDVEECCRRSSSDVGMFDGIEDEVDFVIKNKKYKLTPFEVAKKIYLQSGGEPDFDK